MVKVAGLLVIHQSPPTAKGVHFLTLEDEFAFINIVVRPQIYVRYRQILREYPLLVVQGEIQRQGQVINIVANSIWSL